MSSDDLICVGCDDDLPRGDVVDWDEDGPRCSDCVIIVGVPAAEAQGGGAR